MSEGVRQMQAIGRQESLAARRYLRKHVNSLRRELGQPSVETEALTELRARLAIAGDQLRDAMIELHGVLQKPTRERT